MKTTRKQTKPAETEDRIDGLDGQMDENLDEFEGFLNENPDDIIDAADGDDQIEIEQHQHEKFNDSTEFYSAHDSAIGDDSEDKGDLPPLMQKQGHHYDPTLSSGKGDHADRDAYPEGYHITNESGAGMAYGPDEYVKDSPQKKKNRRS